MTLKTGNFLDWASGEASSIFEAMARNFTPSGSFGPTTVAKGCVSERLDPFLSTSQLGILSGVVLFLFLRHKLSRWREELSHLKVASGTNIRQAVYTFLTFIEFLALSPVFLVVLITFHLCRITVGFVLRWRHGKHFKGLLDGADVVWAIEDQNSRGMINILASVHESFVDFESVDGSMSADLLLTLRKRISGRLMRNYQPLPKMFWKRNVELGYYFWSDQSELTIEDYIRYLDTIPLAEGQRSIDECQLRALLSKINNRHLPANHTSSWEVLVGRQPLVDECRKIIKYPIIFRVHHSLGDGVALMRLLLEAIVDKEVPSRWKHLSTLKIMNIDYILKNQSIADHLQVYRNETLFKRLWKCVPSYSDLLARRDAILRVFWTVYTAPAFFNEVSRRQADNNCIHATKMANEKVVSWIHEERFESSRWVDIIKRTKRLLPGTRFSDVFLAALSASLEAYFTKITGNPPKSLTVVLPARIEKESPHLKLHNRFSVALQTLPIASGIQLEDPNRHYTLTKRILAVKSYSDALRSTSDYMINYWIISKMTSLFPEIILRKILKSAHSTLAISNLPGPQQMPRIQGRELKNLCFFIPNLGTTAVGITLLTYGGTMQLGILADRAVIPNEDDAHSILQGTIEEIERMGKLLEEV
uniref:O-acyltransferase WSD1 C-terminal domain-containing protein n=1 Tax=Anopheles atroparvus TaxID=41427 RepID=A0AAG5DXH6_ANOAO